MVGACPRLERKFGQKLILSTNPFWHVGTLDRSQMTLCWVNSMSDTNTEEYGVLDASHPLGANHKKLSNPAHPKGITLACLPPAHSWLLALGLFVCVPTHCHSPMLRQLTMVMQQFPQIPHAGMCWLVHASLMASEFWWCGARGEIPPPGAAPDPTNQMF